MAESTTLTRFEDVQHLYRVSEVDKVGEYLASRPELADFLVEARPHVESHFGRGISVELRFPRNYDGEHSAELLAMIQSDLDADDALDRLWDEWWGDASGRPESWPLYIGVEYAAGSIR